MSILRLVADDLTGALDAGAQFTQSHGALRCSLGPVASWPDHESLVIDLGCRDGARSAAVERTLATLPLLQGGDLAFKKIDSLLRGYWAAELAAISRSGFFAVIVLAPAFPAQGRATRAGRQWARLSGHEWTMVGPDPMAALAAEGLPTFRAGQGTSVAAIPHGAVLVCDAETAGDLDRVAAMARDLASPVLWCGSAGLGHALAGTPPRPLPRGERPHLGIVGTDHSVTQAQVAHWREMAPDRIVTFDHDGPASAARITGALAQHGHCLALPGLPSCLKRGDAAAVIDAWLGTVFNLLQPPASLTISGGETFLALCRAVSVDHLLLLGEQAPGLPISRLVGGPWDGVSVLSKSGAFGHATLLSELFDI